MIKRGASLLLASGMVLATVAFAQTPKKTRTTDTQTPQPETLQQAVAFERAKDRADARQARLEARRPSVPPAPNAERSVDQSTVKDQGPGPKKD